MTLVLAVAAVAFTAACSAGQRTQTDQKVPSVPGANAQARVSPGTGSVSVRNAQIAYPGPAGYPAGADAPVEVRIFNDTADPIRLTGVTSDSGTVVITGGSAGGTGGWLAPAPTPSASAPAATRSAPAATPTASTPAATPSAAPSAPAAGSTEITIPAGGFVVLAPGEAQSLRLTGLTKQLKVGHSVRMVFRFSGAATIPLIDILVPVAPPTEPAPRSPMQFEHGEEVGHG